MTARGAGGRRVKESKRREVARRSRLGLVARSVLGALGAYKRYLSPLLPPSCRYSPTCSEYAALAVRQRGVWVGLCLAVGRVMRCHPFAAGGLDLPPGGSQSNTASAPRAVRPASSAG